MRRKLDQLWLEAAPDAAIIVDETGGVPAWNGAAGSILGYSESDAFRRSLNDLIVPPDQLPAAALVGCDGDITQPIDRALSLVARVVAPPVGDLP